MEYRFCPGVSSKYATNLRVDNVSKMMVWDISRGTDTLVVQTPYEQDARAVIPSLCEKLNQKGLKEQEYTRLPDDVWVRFVSAAEKVANGGCKLNKKASRYTVLACQNGDDGICQIYEPYEHGMNIPYRDIPLEVHIDIRKQMFEARRFRKRTQRFTGFYILTFPEELKGAYIEGGLCYKVDGLEIPVTQEMVRQGKVYIEAMSEPEVVPLNKGILIKNM